MKPIAIEDYCPEFEGDFMEQEFNPSLLRTVKQESLQVTHDGIPMPDDYNVMVTDTHYIFRLIHPFINDGFNIYRIPKTDIQK